MTNSWIIFSFIATIISSISVILINHIANSKYDNIIFMAISYIIVGVFGFIYMAYDLCNKKKIINNCDYTLILYAFIFAIIIVISNIIIQYAFSISPNISYTHIIINLNIIFTIIASYVLYNQNINIYCFSGMFISLFGIIIIFFNYKN